MKPFVLRRLKEDVLQDLPKKTDCVIHVPMAPTQRERYEELVNTFQSASKDVSLIQGAFAFENSTFNNIRIFSILITCIGDLNV